MFHETRSPGQLLHMLAAAVLLSACSALPADTTDPTTPPTPGNGLLIAGVNTLTLMDLPDLTVRETISGVSDAILLPDGRIAAGIWSHPNNGASEGEWAVVVLNPETLTEMGRTQVEAPVEWIGPNPASRLAVSPDGRWMVGIRWPEGRAVGLDVELWVVRLETLRLIPEAVPLPVCGGSRPAATSQPDRFTVVCGDDDIRFVTLATETGAQVDVVPLPEGRTERGLSLDRMVDVSAAGDGTRYLTRGGGEIYEVDWQSQTITQVGDLMTEDRYLPGINTLSPDGGILYVGSGPLSDRTESTGRRQADRLHAIDVDTGRELWTLTSPRPFTHIAAAPDGTLYATLYPQGDPPTPDPALMRFDPDDQSAEVLISNLEIPPGPITVIP